MIISGFYPAHRNGLGFASEETDTTTGAPVPKDAKPDFSIQEFYRARPHTPKEYRRVHAGVLIGIALGLPLFLAVGWIAYEFLKALMR